MLSRRCGFHLKGRSLVGYQSLLQRQIKGFVLLGFLFVCFRLLFVCLLAHFSDNLLTIGTWSKMNLLPTVDAKVQLFYDIHKIYPTCV